MASNNPENFRTPTGSSPSRTREPSRLNNKGLRITAYPPENLPNNGEGYDYFFGPESSNEFENNSHNLQPNMSKFTGTNTGKSGISLFGKRTLSSLELEKLEIDLKQREIDQEIEKMQQEIDWLTEKKYKLDAFKNVLGAELHKRRKRELGKSLKNAENRVEEIQKKHKKHKAHTPEPPSLKKSK